MKAFALALLPALLLSACRDSGDDKKPASQVAAKVNAGEISVHQINFLLQRNPNVPPEKVEETKRQILDGLVDQELAVQQALEAKLDRDPKVMQTMEAARREILARAYMEQTMAGKGKPSADEVRAYFRAHPELFTNRKVYRLQEIGFPANPNVVATVREQLTRARRGDELLNALRNRGIKVAGSIMAKASENISLDILPRLAQMKEGESALFENGQQASIVTILSAVPEPIGEEAARPLIEEFLSRRQRTELAKETMQQLRGKARIEYVGEFGKAAEAARLAREEKAAQEAKAAREAREAARLAQATEDAQRAATARKAREAAEAARGQQPGRLAPPADSTIQKGLSSLK